MMNVQLYSERMLQLEQLPKTERLNAEIIALARTNSALATALLDLHARKQRFEELERGYNGARRERVGGFFGRVFGKGDE